MSISATRTAMQTARCSSRGTISARVKLSAPKQLHTTFNPRAQYERFPSSGSGGYGSGGGGFNNGQRRSPGGGPSGRPHVVSLLRRRLGGDRAVLVYGVGVGGAVVYYVAHLEKVPETGRRRFMDVDEAQEREMGSQAQLSTLSEYSHALLPPNHPTSRRVRAVAKRLIEGAGLGRMKSGGELSAVEGRVPAQKELDFSELMFGGGQGQEEVRAGKEVEWEVYVIDDKKTPNAFVLPGGKIFVFTGILPVCANDDGLASVLGHEVAHQVARHSAERMSSMKVLFVLGFLLESLGLDVGISRLLLTFLMQLPNSRKAESEADYIGIRLMAKACFNPEESTKMWTRMSEMEGSKGGSVDFMSTHPANEKRIKVLQASMAEAQQIRAASPCGPTSNNYSGFTDAAASMFTGRSVWQ